MPTRYGTAVRWAAVAYLAVKAFSAMPPLAALAFSLFAAALLIR